MEGIITALTWQLNNPGEIPPSHDEMRVCVYSSNDARPNYSALQTACIALCGTKWVQLD